jgi:serine/threonine protein phosphatase 1
MYEAVLDLDLSQCKGRILVAADIHGSFAVLDDALERIGYEPDRDVVVLIGDLIDRGAESHRCMEWIDVPGRYCLKGNHESYIEGVCDGRIAQIDHVEDGGSWFYRLSDIERSAYRSALMALPLAARVITPRRRRVGMIHADVAGSHFWQFCGHLRHGDYRAEQIAMNGRSRLTAVRQGQQIPLMSDVDHMFFGHSPVPDPVTVGNCSWIDTGLPHSGQVTLVDVDDWIDRR